MTLPFPPTRPLRPPSTPLSRRRFLRSLGAAAGVGVLSPMLLAACGGDDDDGGGGSASDVRVENWPLYIDEETGPLFEAETGRKLVYSENINDNNEYFAVIQPSLSAGKSINRDVITPTSWLAVRLQTLDWLQKLPIDKVPNAKNLLPSLQKPVWDPTGEWSLPWQSGMTGIAYNRDAAGKDLGSFADLLDPAFKGRVGMLKEMRDTMGLAILATGKDPESVTLDDATEAFDLLEKAKADGQIRQFTGNDYQDDLVAGNFVACVGWSGDVAQLALDNPALRFVIPEEGGMLFSDVMCIPANGANPDAAAAWMNFVYDPVNAARITASVQYISPVTGVKEALAKAGGDSATLSESALVFPDDAVLSRLRVFKPLSEDEEAGFEERFAKLTGG
jgi:spermidine/putrescine transport system substrate-binding protein